MPKLCPPLILPAKQHKRPQITDCLKLILKGCKKFNKNETQCHHKPIASRRGCQLKNTAVNMLYTELGLDMILGLITGIFLHALLPIFIARRGILPKTRLFSF